MIEVLGNILLGMFFIVSMLPILLLVLAAKRHGEAKPAQAEPTIEPEEPGTITARYWYVEEER